MDDLSDLIFKAKQILEEIRDIRLELKSVALSHHDQQRQDELEVNEEVLLGGNNDWSPRL